MIFRPRLAAAVTVLVVTAVVANVALANVGAPLKAAKLSSCLQLRGGFPDTTGVHSKAFSYGVDQDPTVGALILVSGKNPRPSVATRIVTNGRKPTLTKRFSNVRIDAYTFHKNGTTPLPGAMTAARAMVAKIVTACIAAAR